MASDTEKAELAHFCLFALLKQSHPFLDFLTSWTEEFQSLATARLLNADTRVEFVTRR